MRGLVATCVVVLLLAGCEDSNDSGSNKPDPTVKLVQKRYGHCLDKLHAKNADPATGQVSYDTDEGLLVISVVERNGKTYTNPASSEDVRVLKTVGC